MQTSLQRQVAAQHQFAWATRDASRGPPAPSLRTDVSLTASAFRASVSRLGPRALRTAHFRHLEFVEGLIEETEPYNYKAPPGTGIVPWGRLPIGGHQLAALVDGAYPVFISGQAEQDIEDVRVKPRDKKRWVALIGLTPELLYSLAEFQEFRRKFREKQEAALLREEASRARESEYQQRIARYRDDAEYFEQDTVFEPEGEDYHDDHSLRSEQDAALHQEDEDEEYLESLRRAQDAAFLEEEEDFQRCLEADDSEHQSVHDEQPETQVHHPQPLRPGQEAILNGEKLQLHVCPPEPHRPEQDVNLSDNQLETPVETPQPLRIGRDVSSEQGQTNSRVFDLHSLGRHVDLNDVPRSSLIDFDDFNATYRHLERDIKDLLDVEYTESATASEPNHALSADQVEVHGAPTRKRRADSSEIDLVSDQKSLHTHPKSFEALFDINNYRSDSIGLT
ncbi:hypothetical protein CDD81_2503 [Ophiocordyceps australis]|uniref:Uncharacterized protein n=1 Tax=Ophiocordyceps australis TaxID=1399860 RepID=A0A2C5XB02_9HYPO|nr:hypothetical protein CDD81_2503 [Ophiocordyceps australis]